MTFYENHSVLKDAFIIARSTLAVREPGQGIEVRLFDGSHLPRGVHHSLDSLVTDILRMDAATGWAYAQYEKTKKIKRAKTQKKIVWVFEVKTFKT